jgi:hypothetical protein
MFCTIFAHLYLVFVEKQKYKIWVLFFQIVPFIFLSVSSDFFTLFSEAILVPFNTY